MAEHLARPEIRAGRLVELLSDHTVTDDTAFHLVVLPDRHRVPRIRGFMDFMVGAFKTPDW